MDAQITNALYNILLAIVTTGTPIIIGYIVLFMKNHASAQQLKIAESLAVKSVGFAQQVSGELGLDNQGKFDSALVNVKAIASKYGLNFTDEQWAGLLLPALIESKKGWNDVVKVSLPTDNSDGTQVILSVEKGTSATPESVAIPVIEDIVVKTQES